MANKTVWLTWLPKEDGGPGPQDTIAFMTHSGLQVGGAPWVDDHPNLAWAELGNLLLGDKAPDVWLVAGEQADFTAPGTRYALSMVAAMVREADGAPVTACLGLDGPLAEDALPSLLREAERLDAGDFGWAGKLLSARRRSTEEDFRLSVIAQRLIGQWVEVGPAQGEWQGAMIGASSGGKVTFQAVGEKGQLPEKAVLEYPLEGLQAELAGTTFTAWAVQNKIGPDQSYFVRLEGQPERLILGQHPESDNPEVRVIDLI
jgi:hypothetical protein